MYSKMVSFKMKIFGLLVAGVGNFYLQRLRGNLRKRPGPSLAIHPTTLTDLIDRAFSRFRHREVVHLSRLRNGLNVLELWHGVTYAFKDLSLSCTAQFLQYFLEKREKHVTVVVGVFWGTNPEYLSAVTVGCPPMGCCSWSHSGTVVLVLPEQGS